MKFFLNPTTQAYLRGLAAEFGESTNSIRLELNRLEKAKQLITQIINGLAGDRIGIIGYAGSAFPQVPITSDFSSAKLFLSGMNTDMVSSQGTAITQ